jgi:DNA-binding CsgD family transcriptional regulator
LRAELVRLAIIDSLPSREPRLLGGISFIDPEYVREARTAGSTLPNTVMRAALEGRKPFLPPAKIAEMNASAELHMMNFFGNINTLDLRDSEMANFYEVSNRGYHFLHSGYAYRAMWAEVWPPHHVQELKNHGMHIERELRLPSGRTSTLMCLTRERALANPYTRRSGFFFPLAPRFGFSPGEQNLLELTLLGLADDEIAASVHVSMDAIKKRWRSIYTKVGNADPGLLATTGSGTAQRRELLSYLEVHLEEIRPYSS